MSVEVLLHEITGGNEAEEAFLRGAVGLLREAVRKPGFGASVRDADYGNAMWKSRHGALRQFDGRAIWERIAAGRESGRTGDHALDLKIEIADLPGPETGRPVIGATNLGEFPIRIARWFVSHCMFAGDRVNMAAHTMHQWMHVSGFVHCLEDHPGERGARDAPAIVARLVRRALESDHGDEIDAEITALLIGSDTGEGVTIAREQGTGIVVERRPEERSRSTG